MPPGWVSLKTVALRTPSWLENKSNRERRTSKPSSSAPATTTIRVLHSKSPTAPSTSSTSSTTALHSHPSPRAQYDYSDHQGGANSYYNPRWRSELRLVLHLQLHELQPEAHVHTHRWLCRGSFHSPTQPQSPALGPAAGLHTAVQTWAIPMGLVPHHSPGENKKVHFRNILKVL